MDANAANAKGDPTVLKALKKAATQQMTAEERHQQKVSFIMGTMGSDSRITSKEVEKILAEQEA